MRVAIIIERYDISLGGAEWLVYELASMLRQNGNEVDILAAKGRSNEDNVHYLLDDSGGRRTDFKIFGQAVRRYLDQNNYDITHSALPFGFCDVYQPPGGSFAEAIIRNSVSYQNKFIETYKNLTAFINRHRAAMLDAEKKLCIDPNGPVIAALSNYVKEQFQSHYNVAEKRIPVIPNGVRTDRVVDTAGTDKLRSQIFQQLGITEASKAVLFLLGANNFRLKGVGVLTEAIAALKKNGTERKPYVVIAGGGKIEEFRSLAQKLGVNERFAFLGNLDHIQNAFAVTDVAILPTFFDPCSRYILEALAAGKPVITSKFNGASEQYVNYRHGITITSPDNIAELAEAVRYFTDTNNIEKASRAIVQDNLKEKVCISHMTERLLPIYEAILKERNQK